MVGVLGGALAIGGRPPNEEVVGVLATDEPSEREEGSPLIMRSSSATWSSNSAEVKGMRSTVGVLGGTPGTRETDDMLSAMLAADGEAGATDPDWEELLLQAATSRRARWLVSILGVIDLREVLVLSGMRGGSWLAAAAAADAHISSAC